MIRYPLQLSSFSAHPFLIGLFPSLSLSMFLSLLIYTGGLDLVCIPLPFHCIACLAFFLSGLESGSRASCRISIHMSEITLTPWCLVIVGGMHCVVAIAGPLAFFYVLSTLVV